MTASPASPATPPARLRTHALPLVALVLLFLWVYGRFALRLYFVMDDFIHGAVEMPGPLAATLRDAFSGAISWSGYRPLAISMRALLYHAFGLERMAGYYVIYLGLHLANTLLSYRVVWRVARSAAWAFFAAGIVLLLPAHNEAVLWFAANSNLLALFFSLLALECALHAWTRPHAAWPIACALAYACAVLAYEVTFPLPLLILLADWILNRRAVRTRWRFYLGLVFSAAALLALRLLVQTGTLVPARSDYAASFDLAHLLRGYHLLLSQIVLLYNSPYPSAPLYGYSRIWLAPLGLPALSTIALALLLSTAVLLATRPQTARAAAPRRLRVRSGLLWCGWGLIWLLALGFAFASLTGRNPENRYTYLLSFGFAVALTGLLAALYHSLQRARVLQDLLLALMAGLLAFYAFVSIGDAQEWAYAGDLVRGAQATIHAAVPSLDPDQTIGQIGIPAHVGAAYAYSIERAFQDAMFLLYGQGQPGFATNQAMRAWFAADPARAEQTYAFTFDYVAQRVVPLVAIILCATPDDCQFHELRRPEGTSLNRGVRYVQIYDPANPQMGGVGFYATLQPYAVQGCYLFQDYNVDTAPLAFVDYPLEQRCNDAAAAFWDYAE